MPGFYVHFEPKFTHYISMLLYRLDKMFYYVLVLITSVIIRYLISLYAIQKT